MTNRDIAKAFANGATKGRNGNSTIFIDGDTVYSYGRHWPIARRNGDELLVNGDRYSVTTSRHTSLIAGTYNANRAAQITYVPKAELIG